MKFNIEKKGNPNASKYRKEVIDIAYQFAKGAHEEFQELAKAVVLFGSSARGDGDENSDIDILIIFDDVNFAPNRDLVEAYKIISEKLIAKISKRIHITTIRYSTFFDHVRTGDPIGINILRDGVALIDTGFFAPLQVLLREGKFRPTYESVWSYFNRAPDTLNNSRWHLLRACEDLYWAVTDASHAAIMKQGISPPSPKHMPVLFEKHLVQPGFFKKSHLKTLSFFIDLYKSITKRDLKDVTGSQYEKYYAEARSFVLDVEAFLKR